MKKYLLSFCCVLFPLLLAAQDRVIISEILYQPPYPNEGQNPHMHNGEFASIYNYGNVPVDISGWRLISDPNQIFEFPQEIIMQPGAKFYVAYRSLNGNNTFKLEDLYDGFQPGINDRVFYQRTIIHVNGTGSGGGESLRLYRQDGTMQDSIYYDGSAPNNALKNPPRLYAPNTDGTPGNECRSIQRINVSIVNGTIISNRSDWVGEQLVALANYPTSTLTENWGPIAFAKVEFEYDPSGNRTARRTIVLSTQSPLMAKSSPARNSKNNSSSDDETNEDNEDDKDDFSVFGSVETPESNDSFDKFYTDKLNESDVVIYPNPTKGALAVEIRNKNPQIPHHLAVYNLSGSIIFQRSNVDGYTEIDLSSQPIGMYLMRISSQNSFVTWRIIKE
jgi:hypothetical protein